MDMVEDNDFDQEDVYLGVWEDGSLRPPQYSDLSATPPAGTHGLPGDETTMYASMICDHITTHSFFA